MFVGEVPYPYAYLNNLSIQHIFALNEKPIVFYLSNKPKRTNRPNSTFDHYIAYKVDESSTGEGFLVVRIHYGTFSKAYDGMINLFELFQDAVDNKTIQLWFKYNSDGIAGYDVRDINLLEECDLPANFKITKENEWKQNVHR